MKKFDKIAFIWNSIRFWIEFKLTLEYSINSYDPNNHTSYSINFYDLNNDTDYSSTIIDYCVD